MTKKTETKTIYKNKWKFEPTGEKNNKPSQTVQGEAYTIQELLKKHANGIMPPVGLDPLYDHDEPTFEDDLTLRKPDLDLTDIEDIKNKVSKANETRAKHAEYNDRMSKAKTEAQTVQRSGTVGSVGIDIEETSERSEA